MTYHLWYLLDGVRFPNHFNLTTFDIVKKELSYSKDMHTQTQS